jgi:hypothetical protein
MDRKDLRALSRVRLSEARALLKAGLPDGAHTHDLEELVKVAELQDELVAATNADPLFRQYWNDVREWSEHSRYSKHSQKSAQDLIVAMGDRNHGVMKWVRHYW